MTAYNRYCRVTLGTKPKALQIEGGSLFSATGRRVQQGLRIEFKIHKHLKVEFNSKHLAIYNLSKDSQKKIVGNISIRVEAGYADNFGTVFVGHARVIDHYREGADWVTSIQAGDGWQAYNKVAYSSWGKGTSLESVATFLAEKAGVGAGNLREILQGASREKLEQFAHGHVSNGGALRQLDQLIRSCDLTWSIQDEQIQVVRKNVPVSSMVPLISPATGLVDSPKHIAWKPNWPTFVAFKSLLNANLRCGHAAILKSENINGKFQLWKIKHVGDTMGNDWYTECEGLLSKALPA